MSEAIEKNVGMEHWKVPLNERVLSEVDNLMQHRKPDGTYESGVQQDVLTNLRTAVQEASMPYAVSTVRQELEFNPEKQANTFMWLGKTALEAAMSGYKFHRHESAIKRVDVEVDEARHATESLNPGVMKIFISPRMTRKDAPLEIAKQEHLSADDAVRVSWLETDNAGAPSARVMQSLLVRDIPLQAWTAMLEDSNNMFGKSIDIEDKESALSVMKVHRELEVPIGMLPGGPVDVVEAVLPYIEDKTVRADVTRQIELFKLNQNELTEKAQEVAERWLDFELAMSESLKTGKATFEIQRFIVGLQEFWNSEDLRIIQNHQLPNAQFAMSRELAVVLEEAKQNTLWGAVAAVSNNEAVIGQMDQETALKIQTNEHLIQVAKANGMEYLHLEAENNRLVAGQNVKVGGGCTGSNEAKFGVTNNNPIDGSIEDNNLDTDPKSWKWKKGTCQVKACGKNTEVGPCSVCRNCQAKFDRGEDPTKTKSFEAPKKAEIRESKELWAEFMKGVVDTELNEIIEQSQTGRMQPKDDKSLATV